MNRKQTDYDKLVGRIGNEYYFCDYIFRHYRDFKGATATILRPVSEDEYNERMDPTSSDTQDWFGELWRDAVASERTEVGLEEWIEWVLDNDGPDAIFDLSCDHLWDDLREAVLEFTEEDYPVFECIGGGRCFSPDMKWDEIYDNKLWQKIKKVEAK